MCVNMTQKECKSITREHNGVRRQCKAYWRNENTQLREENSQIKQNKERKTYLWHWHRLWWKLLMVQQRHSELEPAVWSSWWSRNPGALPPEWRLNHPLGWGSSRSELACWFLGPCRPPSCKSPWDPQEGRWPWWSVWNKEEDWW